MESGDCALVKIVPLKAMVVEEFTVFPPLGRLSVRDSNKSVAVGIIKSVVKKMWEKIRSDIERRLKDNTNYKLRLRNKICF